MTPQFAFTIFCVVAAALSVAAYAGHKLLPSGVQVAVPQLLVTGDGLEPPPRAIRLVLRVRGTPTGDGECWCLAVSAETYRAVRGEADYVYEAQCRREWIEDGEQLDPDAWFLYPNDLLNYVLPTRDQAAPIEIVLTAIPLAESHIPDPTCPTAA